VCCVFVLCICGLFVFVNVLPCSVSVCVCGVCGIYVIFVCVFVCV